MKDLEKNKMQSFFLFKNLMKCVELYLRDILPGIVEKEPQTKETILSLINDVENTSCSRRTTNKEVLVALLIYLDSMNRDLKKQQVNTGFAEVGIKNSH